jgi:hypothetical protein
MIMNTATKLLKLWPYDVTVQYYRQPCCSVLSQDVSSADFI